MAEPFTVRPAGDADLPAIAAIYNHEVTTSTATMELEPVTLPERRAWLADHPPARYPVLVAARAGAVLGWSSLSPWSARGGYARTAEVSVYVDRVARGQGVGRALLAALVAAAPPAGIAVLIARIGGESAASIALHRALGFRHLATMRAVGHKLGRLVDIELLELHLG